MLNRPRSVVIHIVKTSFHNDHETSFVYDQQIRMPLWTASSPYILCVLPAVLTAAHELRFSLLENVPDLYSLRPSHLYFYSKKSPLVSLHLFIKSLLLVYQNFK